MDSNMVFVIATILLSAFIATSTGATEWDGFVASWSLNTSTHFYDLPRTLEDAESQGWTRISGVNPPKGVTPLGFYGDPTFVLLFQKGVVIGFEVAFLVSEVEHLEQPLKWDELDAVIKKMLNEELYYTATTYFYNDESTGIRRIWFQEKDRLYEIPMNASLLPLETEFQLMNCIPTMGTHYYTWISTADCATLYPWFLLAIDDDIVGVGFQGFGNLTTIGTRKWWETVPDGAIEVVLPDPPVCAVNATAEYGAISLHIWFVEEPQNITCSS